MILTGDMAGKRFDIPEGGMRLGRSSSNDIHIPDEELSRNHCLFEPDGMADIRIIDLASANGTYVNSVQLGASALVLKVGDIIEAGRTTMKVIENEIQETIITRGVPPPPPPSAPPQLQSPLPQKHPTPPPPAATTAEPQPKPPTGVIDLGLDNNANGAEIAANAPSEAKGDKRLSMRLNILWGVVAVLIASAIALILLMPTPTDAGGGTSAGARKSAAKKSTYILKTLRYEKIDADSSHIFRFEMSIDSTGNLRALCDDVPAEGRHIKKDAKLTSDELAELAGLFTNGWENLEHEYSGRSSMEENCLKRFRIGVNADKGMGESIYKEVIVENTDEPKRFRTIREKLENFSSTKLDLWTMMNSRENLISRIQECETLADNKMADCDVQHGNVAAALAYYREAISYAKQFDPRPPGYDQLLSKRDRAETLLNERYEEQRKAASIANTQKDWRRRREHLRIILEMIPDENDRRHREARRDLNMTDEILSGRRKNK